MLLQLGEGHRGMVPNWSLVPWPGTKPWQQALAHGKNSSLGNLSKKD